MMPTLFAQTPPPAAVTSWLEVLFYLAGGIAAVVLLIKQFTGKSEEVRITPSPLEVKAHPIVASQADLDQVHGRIKRERMELDAKIRELQEEDRRLREKLDGEIKELNERIDAVPERTIKLLRETKGLI